MMIVILFIIGIAIGSFLNVVMCRLNLGETVLGRSYCPHCRAQIHWHDNIPLLSFFLLGGRCRDCGDRISWQYPAVELATGLLFAGVGILFFENAQSPLSWIEAGYYSVLASLFVILFVYDLKHMEVPMLIVWVGVIAVIVHHLALDLWLMGGYGSLSEYATVSGLVGGGIAFILLFSLSFASKERWMGMGDAYVFLLAGLVVGWPMVFYALFLSFTLGAAAGVALIIAGGKNLQAKIPFVPYILAGAAITVFLKAALPQADFFLLL